MDSYIRSALARNIEQWAPKEKGPERDNFFKSLSSHPDLTTEVIKRYRNECWCPQHMCANKKFEWAWVDLLPTKPWNWRTLSFSGPTIDIVLKNLDKNWDWAVLSLEPGITFSDMAKWPNLPWNINQVLFVEVISDSDIEFLRIYKDHYDDIAWVDHTRRTRWSLIRKHPDLPWRYHAATIDLQDESDVRLLMNQANINWSRLSVISSADVILKTKDLAPWNWSAVSLNKSLTYEHVIQNPDIPWMYSVVPAQRFTEDLARRWMATFKIQQVWRQSISNPSYRVCRRRLDLEFLCMDSINVAE